MNFQHTLEHFLHYPTGIHGVMIVPKDKEPLYGAHPSGASEKIFLKTAGIASLAKETIRVVYNTWTFVGYFEPEVVIVVQIQTGHEIAKSLQRMLRRAMARARKGEALVQPAQKRSVGLVEHAGGCMPFTKEETQVKPTEARARTEAQEAEHKKPEKPEPRTIGGGGVQSW